MSIKYMTAVWDLPLKGNDKLVMLALADHANDDGECYPSWSKIQDKTGVSKGTLSYIIKVLEGIGLLSHKKRFTNYGKKTSNLYTITLVNIDEKAYKKLSKEVRKKAPSSEVEPSKLSSEVELTDSSEVELTDSSEVEPSTTEPLNITVISEPSTCAEAVVITDFDCFWENYPRKVGKANAKKAWEKHKPDLDAVLASLSTQKLSEGWKKNNGKFIPHPTTWINGERWNDEVELSPSEQMQAVQAVTGMSALEQLEAMGMAS